MEKLISRYQNNALLSKKKHIYTRLLDYFGMFVVSYLLYTLLLPLAARMPFADEIARGLNSVSRETYDYIDSTHLQHYNEDKTKLITINEDAAKYVKYLAKTSCYVHDIDFPVKQEDHSYKYLPVEKKDTFVNDLLTYEFDNNSYYYHIFKKSVESLNSYNISSGVNKKYENCTYQEIDEYIHLNKMSLSSYDFVSSDDIDLLAKGEGISRFNVLTKENTNIILNYFKEDRLDKTLYNKLYKCYANGIQAGIKDVENNCVPYKTITDKFTYWYQKTSSIYIVAFTLSYVIAYLLLFLLPRLIFKEWQTVSQHIFNVGIADKHECEPSVWRIIAYQAINFVLFYTTMFIALLLMGKISTLSFYLIPGITFLSVMIFILVFNFIDLFMPLFTKQNHDCSTFASGILLKDKGEFDVPIDELADLKQEDNING